MNTKPNGVKIFQAKREFGLVTSLPMYMRSTEMHTDQKRVKKNSFSL